MPGYQEHLFIGFLSSGIVIALLYFIFHINIFDGNLLTILIIVTLIFSVLPDIDHTSSRISIYLHFSFIASIIVLFTNKINFSFILIVISLAGLEVYHWTHAKDNWEHRQFPHTFTFGVLALIVLFLITQSLLSILVGAISFFSHILLDGHFDEAITQDKQFWKSLISK